MHNAPDVSEEIQGFLCVLKCAAGISTCIEAGFEVVALPKSYSFDERRIARVRDTHRTDGFVHGLPRIFSTRCSIFCHFILGFLKNLQRVSKILKGTLTSGPEMQTCFFFLCLVVDLSGLIQ